MQSVVLTPGQDRKQQRSVVCQCSLLFVCVHYCLPMFTTDMAVAGSVAGFVCDVALNFTQN